MSIIAQMVHKDLEAIEIINIKRQYLQENPISAKIDDFHSMDNMGVGQLFLVTEMDYTKNRVRLELYKESV